MILCCGDIHLGYKGHSQQLPHGLVTAEDICIDILGQLLTAFKNDEVSSMVFVGDLCHTSHPSPLIIDYLIKWFKDLDAVGKPAWFIPGNHDVSSYAHAFIYIRQLSFKNICVIDALSDDNYVKLGLTDTTLHMVPFVFGTDKANKYNTVQEYCASVLSQCKSGNHIIFSHFQESEATLGSESALISKSVEALNMDEYDVSNASVLCVLGHIHKHQFYTKANGIKVVYTGNPQPIDKSDCNQQKGYLLVDEFTLNYQFKPLKQLRNFTQYKIGADTEIIDYLSKVRVPRNSYIFIDKVISTDADRVIDYTDINKLLAMTNSKIEDIKFIRADVQSLICTASATTLNTQAIYTLFKDMSDIEIKQKYADSDYAVYLDDTKEVIEATLGVNG